MRFSQYPLPCRQMRVGNIIYTPAARGATNMNSHNCSPYVQNYHNSRSLRLYSLSILSYFFRRFLCYKTPRVSIKFHKLTERGKMFADSAKTQPIRVSVRLLRQNFYCKKTKRPTDAWCFCRLLFVHFCFFRFCNFSKLSGAQMPTYARNRLLKWLCESKPTI